MAKRATVTTTQKPRGRPPGSRNKAKLPPRTHNQPLAVERLRSVIQRIERLTEEKQALQGDISDIFAEAKSAGFNGEAIRIVLKLRARPADEVNTLENDVYNYRQAIESGEPAVDEEAPAEVEEPAEVESEL